METIKNIKFKLTITCVSMGDEYRNALFRGYSEYENTLFSGYADDINEIFKYMIANMKSNLSFKKYIAVNAYVLLRGKSHKYICNRQLIIREVFSDDK